MLETYLIPSFAIIIGLIFLVWSSDLFIEGAASTAIHLEISPLVIGVVILGFGTSLPEIIVSILASIDGNPGLAIGNVIGSNITNIGLVLGVTAILSPVVVKSSILKREFPILLGVSIIGILLLLDGTLGFYDGIILLSLLIIVMYFMIKMNKNINESDPLASETKAEIKRLPAMSLKKSIILLVIGLVILMLSAKSMVWGAVSIAHAFGVSDMIIGLTIVAIGTSLPELAAAISAARKNEADLMIGNILGSNLFNLLAVMAMPALIAPSAITHNTLLIDYPVMLAATIAMLLVALPRKGQAIITRFEGSLLLMSFIAYLVVLYFRMMSA